MAAVGAAVHAHLGDGHGARCDTMLSVQGSILPKLNGSGRWFWLLSSLPCSLPDSKLGPPLLGISWRYSNSLFMHLLSSGKIGFSNWATKKS